MVAGLRIWRANLGALFLVALLLSIPTSIASAAAATHVTRIQTAYGTQATTRTVSFSMSPGTLTGYVGTPTRLTGGAAMVALVFGIVLAPLLTLALTRITLGACVGARAGVAHALRAAAGLWGRGIGLQLLLYVAVIAAGFLLLLPLLILLRISLWLGLVIGLVAIFVLSVKLVAIWQPLLAERVGPAGAISRSWRLTGVHLGLAAAALLLVSLALWVAGFVAGIPLLAGSLAWRIAYLTVTNAMLTPISVAVVSALYLQLRAEAREPLDPATIALALDAAGR